MFKLCDFGSSKHLRATLGDASASNQFTLQYAAPEALVRDDTDANGKPIPEQAAQANRVLPATDMWSFGAVLGELLTGSPVWGGKHEIGVLVALSTGKVPDLSCHSWSPLCPLAIRNLVTRLLIFNPEERASLDEAEAILMASASPLTLQMKSPVLPAFASPATTWNAESGGLSPIASLPEATFAAMLDGRSHSNVSHHSVSVDANVSPGFIGQLCPALPGVTVPNILTDPRRCKSASDDRNLRCTAAANSLSAPTFPTVAQTLQYQWCQSTGLENTTTRGRIPYSKSEEGRLCLYGVEVLASCGSLSELEQDS
jgi:serine/threonine protein kinase